MNREQERRRRIAGDAAISAGPESAPYEFARLAQPSPVVDAMPAYRVEPAYLHAIPVANPTINANEQACWLLRRLTPDMVGQEFYVTGAAADLRPSDVNGTALGTLWGFTDPLSWGDAAGVSAHLYVARNTGAVADAWNSMPIDLPAVELGQGAAATTRHLRSPSVGQVGERILQTSFPTGTLRDAAPNAPPLRWAFQPDQYLIARGDTLDVLLVLPRAQITGKTGTIVGYAVLDLTLRLPYPVRNRTPR